MLVKGKRFQRVLVHSELISAILLSIAAVGTAWCAYQSAVWSGIQTFRIAESNRLSRDATMLHLEANQQAMLDIAVGAWPEGRGEPERSLPAEPPESATRLKQQAVAVAEQSDAMLKDAHHANHIADTYLLVTVMLASVLFFAGVAPKFKHPDIQVFLLILGGLNLVGAIVGVVLLPKVFQ